MGNDKRACGHLVGRLADRSLHRDNQALTTDPVCDVPALVRFVCILRGPASCPPSVFHTHSLFIQP
jgi:hypothetical protein